MRPLKEILTDYESIRENFRNFTKVGDSNNGALLEYQQRFKTLAYKNDVRL
jgi:hypothetical protein